MKACFIYLSTIRFKTIIPIPEQSMIQMLCYLLEVLLTPENTPPDCHKDLYELYFVFACIWAFGGGLFQDQVKLGSLPLLLIPVKLLRLEESALSDITLHN